MEQRWRQTGESVSLVASSVKTVSLHAYTRRLGLGQHYVREGEPASGKGGKGIGGGQNPDRKSASS